MQRAELAKSFHGQRAWKYYKVWLKSKHHSTVSNFENFVNSRYFKTFVKFSKFVSSVSLPEPKKFIDFVISKNIDPFYWTDNEVYGLYIEHISRAFSWHELVKISIKTLLNIAEHANVNTSNVVDVLTINDIIQLLQKRLLSPWLILNSNKFTKKLSQANEEQLLILGSLIKASFWKKKFNENPEIVEKIKIYVNEMGI